MKNLKISGKLFVAFGILATALVITMVLSIMSQQHLNSVPRVWGAVAATSWWPSR